MAPNKGPGLKIRALVYNWLSSVSQPLTITCPRLGDHLRRSSEIRVATPRLASTHAWNRIRNRFQAESFLESFFDGNFEFQAENFGVHSSVSGYYNTYDIQEGNGDNST